MVAMKEESERPGAPRTTPGTDQPERDPNPFAQEPSRTPPSKEQRERDDEQEPDDKMDVVMRDTPL